MFCNKCGKEIPDNSQYCEHCGYNLLKQKPRKSKTTKKSKKKVVITIIVAIILISIVFITYRILKPSKIIGIPRTDGSYYCVNFEKLDICIDRIPAIWKIENLVGAIDNGQKFASKAVIIMSKKYEAKEFDSYYYPMCIDLDTGEMEDINPPIPKTEQLDYVLQLAMSRICETGSGCCIFSYENSNISIYNIIPGNLSYIDTRENENIVDEQTETSEIKNNVITTEPYKPIEVENKIGINGMYTDREYAVEQGGGSYSVYLIQNGEVEYNSEYTTYQGRYVQENNKLLITYTKAYNELMEPVDLDRVSDELIIESENKLVVPNSMQVYIKE